MKPKRKALLVAPVLAISLVLALLALPQIGTPRARFVLASPSFPTTTTCMISVYLYDDDNTIAFFSATGETKYAEVGRHINIFHVDVLISTDYADSISEAEEYTRVHGTISHPTAGTVFSDYLDVTEAVWFGTYYFVRFDKTFSEQTLVAGTYTVTTIYQIYA